MTTTDRRWWQQLTAPVRRARWALARWSSGKDRAFHDELFAAQDYDPFSPSYPGYLTIRRFADLAAAHLDGVQTVVDLGCGPGEITCELARRRPDIAFRGLDHSEAAVARARRHAARLGLENATFEAGDAEHYAPDGPVDLVVMFDAFHHVLDPAGLLARLRPSGARIFLVEPAGTWLGGWDDRADVDWLPGTIRQIRARLEHQFGVEAPGTDGARPDDGGTPPVATSGASGGEPTERRYTLTDLERLFAGWTLDVCGTMAGLETYGPDQRARSQLGDRVGDIVYDLVRALEQALVEEGLDLSLRHWAILATPGPPKTPGVFLSRQKDARRLRRPGRGPLLPPYGVDYLAWNGPRCVRPGEAFQAQVTLRNTGWLSWDSRADRPVLLSYHWLDARGRSVVADGLRTPLSRVVNTGESIEAVLRVQAPDTTSRLTLLVDLVHEGTAWFSDEGVVPWRQHVVVRA